MRVPLAAEASGLGLGSSDSTAANSTGGDGSGSAVLSDRSASQTAFEMKRDHTLLMKAAEQRKNYVMAVLYAVSIGMAVYNGVKCVNFHYDPQIIGRQATLLFLIIVCINVEYFLLRDLLG